MSGLEIAGVVLGSIPLIISALEHYADGVRTIRRWGRYKYELKSLLGELRTEQTLFRNTTEMLLDGMTDSKLFEQLLNSPGGDLWHDPTLERKLMDRLHTSYDTYMDRLRDMADVIGGFQDRLGIDNTGKVVWTNQSLMTRAKEAGKLSFSKKTYEDLVSRLKSNNRALQELTSQTAVLQQSRKKRGQARKLKSLRDCAQGLFKALQTLSCSCHHDHSAALELSPDPVTSLINKDRDMSGENFDLHILMTSITKGSDPSRGHISQSIEITIQSCEKQTVKITAQTNTTTGWAPVNPSTPSSISKGKKVLRWASDPSPPVKPVPSSNSIIPNPQQMPRSPLTPPPTGREHPKTYCDLHIRCHKPMLPSYVGSLEGGISHLDMFAIKSLQESASPEPTISLKDILQGKIPGTPMLTRFDKLALSAAAANGVLSLYQSSWLKPAFKTEDFAILNIRDASSPSFKRIFISSPTIFRAAVQTIPSEKAPAVQAFHPLSRLNKLGLVVLSHRDSISTNTSPELQPNEYPYSYEMQPCSPSV